MEQPVTAEDRPDRRGGSPDAFAVLARARRLGSAGLGRLLGWQLVRTALRLAAAASMAVPFGKLIMEQPFGGSLLTALAISVPGAAVAGLMADRAQARTETEVSTALRNDAIGRLQAMPAGRLRALAAGSVTVGLQRHPEAVAGLVIGHRAASLMMAIGPLMAAVALAVVSWQAALLVLVLTPVMILFFALVGETIRSRADAQEKAFSHLAGQFADRIRTLPTILANDALAVEEAKLAGRLDAYTAKTMGVLRIAFINAGLIDFFASLSIAMLAVFLGLGHLGLATIPGFSGLELWQSLFILMIAPDYFAPFRRFSEQYHAKAEGLAASAALDHLLDAEPAPAPALPAVERALSKMTMPPSGLLVISGPSGAGKSTLLRRLAGIEAGPTPSPWTMPQGCVWVATDSFVATGTLAEAIGNNGLDAPCPTRLRAAAASVGLLDDALLPGGLAARIGEGGANLSGGQRLRIALARALVSQRTVIADEPTAKLDPATADAVRRALLDMANSRLVIVASHDPELIALADRRIALDATASLEEAA
ncbi:ATP-binding cassette domain-containing protein [Bosea sp. UNC402CLCol]|uniref:ATP-binding cassette domain-containing protein n=1 Tax=Bosea sp. UNC402CLCol TaxID=1510531 RepID=UPI0009DCDF26|nr:ATP-binding cassette domain-containing protein [Bosea sp. UNC402CLCol]